MRSDRKLAERLRVHWNTLCRWRKDPEWPIGHAAPYTEGEAEAVRCWVAERFGRPADSTPGKPEARSSSAGSVQGIQKSAEGDKSSDGKISRAEAERIRAIEDGSLKRIKRLQLEATLIDRDEHVQIILQYIRLVRLKIEEMVDSMPPILQRKTTRQIGDALEAWYDRLCSDLSSVTSIRIDTGDGPAESTPSKNPAKVKAGKARHARTTR